ncbi:MAG: alpha/beta fold hydrolase [Rhodococcus sp.]|nr:alpha/beta fold hydrolase [Rhodococcus sp. (in: high G+C Gram-positive bacteria)]
MTWITHGRNAGRTKHRTLAGAAMALAAAAGLTLGLVSPASADVIPPADTATNGIGGPSNNWPDALVKGTFNNGAAPIGTNDYSCKPSEKHPRPVVLLHGTWMNAYNSFSGIGPVLKEEGYCLFTLNYGHNVLTNRGGAAAPIPGVFGTRPVEESAKQVATFVDAVLAGTGADKVDIIAHSQGSLVAMQYMKFEGGKDKVANHIALSGTHNGTSLLGIGDLNRFIGRAINIDPLLDWIVGVAGIQQVYDSPVLLNLWDGPATFDGINYTIIGSKWDEIVTPWEITFIPENQGGNVNNVRIQDHCSVDFSDHLSMQYSPFVFDVVKNALDPEGFPADQIKCSPHAWLGGESDGGFGGIREVGGNGS